MTPYKSGQVVTVNGKPEKPAEAREYSHEVVFWESIRGTRDPELYEAYLAQFPDGTFASIARIYLKRQTDPSVAAERIINIVCNLSGVHVDALTGPKRHVKVVRPRQAAMFLLRKYTKLSFPQIGELFGGKDHSSCIHSIEVISRVLADGSDERTADLVNRCTAEVEKIQSLAKAQPEASA